MNNELKEAIYEQLTIYKSEAPSEAVHNFSNMEGDELVMCHFGLGMYIRNNYLLPENKLYKCFIDNGIESKDDMSGIIIRTWHEALNTE